MLADHQRWAAAQALAVLDAYGGVILADEPGLGKSFVAAAVAAELADHGAAIHVVVPAGLVGQWSETLRRFGVAAALLTHDGLVRAEECGRPRPPQPAVPRPAALEISEVIGDATLDREAREARHPSHLVVVDEAHAFRNPKTQRYAALARCTATASVLLVTATPVCNSAADLRALIALIVADDVLAERGVGSIDAAFDGRDLDAIERIVGELVIRRDRHVLDQSLRFGTLQRRVVRHPVAGVAPLIDALEFPLVSGAPLLRRFLRRRVESSEAALIESIRRQMRFYERALESLAAGRVLTKRDYRRAFVHEEDREAFQQVLFWDFWIEPNAEGVTAADIDAEMNRLTLLRRSAESALPLKRSILEEIVGSSADPLLVFTGSAATGRDLFSSLCRITRCGVATARDGRGAIDAFSAGAIDVLIATDIAGEGLNLQRAGIVVHYDIPWNPVRLDQRNGRAWRIGQKRPYVSAIYFLPEGDDSGIVATIAAKNRMRRRVLRPPAIRAAPPVSHLRPRIASSAAAVRLFQTLEKRGIDPPEWLERRHKAGVEQMLESLAEDEFDGRRLDDLLAMVDAERR